MYDKYFIVNPITLDGSPIPKHKGILLNNTNTSFVGITFYFRNASGLTMQAALHFPQGQNILSIQPYGMPAALPGGVTAYYLN